MTARQTHCPPFAFSFICFAAAMLFCGPALGGDDAEAVYKRDAIPFLEKHCIGCHGKTDPKGEISLHVYRDESTVLKGRKLLSKAVNLAISSEMPPKDAKDKNPKPRPTPAEIEVFSKAVTGVFDKADRNAKPDPGRVAMRRLNRAEYNNTMRDLLGIDYNAAEDFPDDEVGHGFDNISDVQWLTPVLLERYMAAAESAIQRSVFIEAPKPPGRWQGGKHLEPAGNGVADSKWRVISGEKPKEAIHTGPLHTEYKIPQDGEYVFKARVYGNSEGGKPMKVAILACGKNVANPAPDAEANKLFGLAVNNLRPFQIVKIVELKGKDEKSAEHITVKLPPNTKFHRMAVAIVKPEAGPVPKLFVENFHLEGPLDTRPAFQRQHFDPPAGKTRDEHTRDFFKRFATRAYRRPPTTEEVDRLVKIVKDAETASLKWEAGMQLALQSILVSPKFLFRPEMVHQSNKADTQPISEYELASRLSYFLWSSMPDDELFALAEKNQLGANIDAQVRRMLKDPRSRALVDNFAMQWLQLRRLYSFRPDAKTFPSYSPQLRESMLQETALFIDAIIREDHSILTMLDADFTFVNDILARHYGIVDSNGNLGYKKAAKPKGDQIKGEQFRRITLTDGDRGGLLTQASVLTVTSNPTRTSPVKRGKWVLEQLLGTPPPPPPPDVPELEGDGKALTGTLRQRMEQHRENPSCAGCHARMDPIGFAFENFDAIGRYRTKDGNFPVDTAGVLPDGRAFKDHVELKGVMKEKKDQFNRCFTEKLLTYALGRGLEISDKRSIDRILEALAKDNYKFSTLAIEIARSEPFRLRRGKDEPKK